MGLNMSLQISFGEKFGFTERTIKLLDPFVPLNVHSKLGFLPESLATQITEMSFFDLNASQHGI